MPIDWIFGPSSEIEKLIDSAIDGQIAPCRAITLGCGVGRETVYLAKKGFDVIGLDFSPAAIKKARHRAEVEGVEVQFIVDDLTNLRNIHGTFDIVTDFGAINDLNPDNRDLYMQNVLPLTHLQSRYLMFCFEKMLPAYEVKKRFGPHFTIETITERVASRFTGPLILYLMIRKT